MVDTTLKIRTWYASKPHPPPARPTFLEVVDPHTRHDYSHRSGTHSPPTLAAQTAPLAPSPARAATERVMRQRDMDPFGRVAVGADRLGPGCLGLAPPDPTGLSANASRQNLAPPRVTNKPGAQTKLLYYTFVQSQKEIRCQLAASYVRATCEYALVEAFVNTDGITMPRHFPQYATMSDIEEALQRSFRGQNRQPRTAV